MPAQPAQFMSEAQYEHDRTPVLAELLRQAANSPTLPPAGHRTGSYSRLADAQLASLDAAGPAERYEAVLRFCELVFAEPAQIQQRSSAIMTDTRVVHRLPVPGDPPFKIFWTTTPAGPRIEAIFTHSRRRAHFDDDESPASDADWARLRDDLLANHPECADCGAEWDFALAVEEESDTADGKLAISLTLDCSAVVADEDGAASEEHELTDGWVMHELYIAL